MSIDKRLAHNSRLLKNLPEKSLENIISLLKRNEWAKNSAIFQEGEAGDHIYFIESGGVTITKKVEGALQTPLAFFGPGQCFGEMSIIDNSVRSATATTNEPSILWSMTRQDFESYLKNDPLGAAIFLMGVLWEVNDRLRHTDELLRDTIYWGMRAGGHLTISETGE